MHIELQKAKGKVALVIGAAGVSGRAVCDLLQAYDVNVIASDPSFKKEEESTGQGISRTSSQSADLLEYHSIDFVVYSPGINPLLPLLIEAKKRFPCFGEHEFGYQTLVELSSKKPFFIGITGTDGKSTTTAILSHLITNVIHFQGISCGNYGQPLSALALELKTNGPSNPEKIYVAECSSFQLESIETFHPEVAMILNIAIDHLDRYSSFEEYASAKMNLLKNQTKDDLFLFGDTISPYKANVTSRARECSLKELFTRYSTEKGILYPGHQTSDGAISAGDPHTSNLLLTWEKFPMLGEHNRMNLMFALAALDEIALRLNCEIDPDQLKTAILTFPGLEHRVEKVANVDGVLFINDTKATTVQAVITALKCFPNQNICLMIGGRDKGSDYRDLLGFKNSTEFFVYGEAAPIIEGQLKSGNTYPNMEKAFLAAGRRAVELENAVVLLSPACSSFDEFKNYKERGERFRDLVKAWAEL